MAQLLSWVVLLGVLSLGVAVSFMNSNCDTNSAKAVIQPGSQAFIGGLQSLHYAGTGGNGCGDLDGLGMQAYEAIRWSLDRLNKKDEILNGERLVDTYIPGVKIGMMVRDYCDSAATAISAAQDMFPQFKAGNRDCSQTPSELMLGLMGASSSGVTKELNSFTSKFQIPLVSFMASAPELTEGTMYPRFMRTISPDGPLMDALVAVMKTVNWKFVVVVYTEDTYGNSALGELRKKLSAAGMCVSTAIPTSPSDTSSSAMGEVFDKVLQTETVGAIYLGSSAVAKALLERGETHKDAGKLQWIFTDSLSLADKFVGKKYPRGVITVLSGSRKITEFEDHMVRINITHPSDENPWFKDWYMTTYKCQLPGNTNPTFSSLSVCPIKTESQRRSEFVQDQFVEPAVHAVFAYARALKEAHQALCGLTAKGLCTSLRDLKTEDFFQNYLKNVSFTYGRSERVESLASHGLEPYNAPAKVSFDADGDIMGPTYDVYNFNDYPGGEEFVFRKLGTYFNGRLEIVATKTMMYDTTRTKALNPLPASTCPGGKCGPCLGVPTPQNYMYVPGDVIINGVFSLHGAGMSALSCGVWNNEDRPGVQYMEGMAFGIQEFNKLSVLRGVSLGGLGFDDCMSSALGNHYVSAVQRNAMMIKDSSGKSMNYRRVEAFIGAFGTALTIPLANLIEKIKKPLLGYASTHSSLEENDYFLYMNYNNEMYVKAFIYMMKQNGWNYVQTVQAPMAYTRDFTEKFRKAAAEEGICVVASYEFMTDGDSKTILAKLEGRPTVQAVIVVGVPPYVTSLLEEVRKQNKMGKFVFMTGLDDSLKMWKQYPAALEGVLNINIVSPDMTAFTNYLKGLRVNTYKANPWFGEWYENMYNCSLDSTNMRSYTASCTNTASSDITGGPNYFMNPGAFTSIYAVYAIGYGLHRTLIQYCGANYQGLCGNFINAGDKGKVLVDKISEVVQTINGFTFQFNNKQGSFPFEYQNFRSGAFVKVGTYDDVAKTYSFNTALLSSGLKNVKPTCPEICRECLYMFSQQDYLFMDGDLIIPGIFDIHYPGPNQYTCGNVRSRNGFLNTEVLLYALNKINSGTANVTLNNVKLGSLIFDGCMNTLRGTTLASALYFGLYPTENGRPKYPLDKMLSFLTYDSGTAINVAKTLSYYNIPNVSPGAVTPVLDDKDVFKTFFRTIPSDGVTSLAMARVAKEMGFQYIITLNAPEQGSRDAVEAFKNHARANGICVGASYEFVTDGSMDTLIEYIASSSTRVVAVFADPDRFIQDMLMAKSRNVAATNIVFLSNRMWKSPVISPAALVHADNALNFGMNVPQLSDFRTYLSQKFPSTYDLNPWFGEFYEEYFSCNLPGNLKYSQACNNPSGKSVVDGNFVEDFTALPTLHAVYSIAEGVHRTLKEKCGANYNGVCSKFKTDGDTFARIMVNMDSLQVYDVLNEMFKFIERESNRGLTIERYKAATYITEGTFGEKTLTLKAKTDLQDQYKKTPSTCIGDCAQCFILGDGTQDFTYYNGDILFVGLFDINKKGQTPYSCGDINDKHGFQLLEAFNFALDYANNRKGMFSNLYEGVTYGGVALDVCQNPTRAGNLVANLHNGNIKLVKNGIRIDPSRFDAYIGTIESESTVRVADVVNPLGIPHISYGATSIELNNQQKYPYFVRTVPSDDKQARGIISFLKRFELPNVQVITTFNSVGLFAKEEFARLARLNRICISQNITVGHSGVVTNSDAAMAINNLFTYPDAATVILFVDDSSPFLKVIESRPDVRSNFTFIGTDKMGYDRDQWDNAKSLALARRAVSFDIETADVHEFDEYLETKQPSVYNEFNPWFDEYFQYIHRCNLPGKGSKYPNTCGTDFLGVPRSQYYTQDPYVLYVINAVFSAVLGADTAVKKMCPAGQLGLCNIFVTSGEKRQEILKGIKAVRFTDTTKQPFYYEATGGSSRGYHIWEAKPATGLTFHTDYMLEDVGSYNDTHHLKIDARYNVDWKSSCDRPGSCTCPFPEYKPSRFMKTDVPHKLYVVYVSDIHKRDPSSPFKCGPIDTVGNFQNLMAFFYALNLVNTNLRLPSTLKLGGIALDTCSAPNRIGQDIYSLLAGDGICESGSAGQIVAPSDMVTLVAKNSQNSISASSILSPLQYTTISPSATSVLLSNKDFHEYFLRTVPPDNVQAVVIAQVFKNFGWDYVSAVYSDTDYGKSAMKTLLTAAENQNPRSCISQSISMKSDATLADAKNIIDVLNRRVGAQVVVLFVSAEQARLLLQATTERGLTHRFVWLASDTWANSEYIITGYEDAAAGAITIQIRSEIVEAFKTYLKSFDINNKMGIPQDWFEDLYQTFHQCRILNSKVQKNYPTICSGEEKITDAMIPDDPYTLHTMISVFLVAEGLNGIEECKRTSLSLAACLSLQPNKKQLIYDAIKKVQLSVLPQQLKEKSFLFKFSDEGFGDIGYNILNYRRDSATATYSYVKIGTFQVSLDLDNSKYQGFSIVGSRTLPLSQCPVGSTCICANSNGTTSPYKREGVSGQSYYVLPDGSYVDTQTGAIVQLESVPELTDRFLDVWGTIVATLAGIGLFISLCTFIYLLVVYPVRGGTSILGFMLSFGIILLYAMVFAFIVHANKQVCGIREFCLGLVYAICYSSLFIKIVDSWRSRGKSEIYEVKYEKLGRPLGFFFCGCLLVMIQVIINAEWMILQEPDVERVLYNKMLWPRCTPDNFYDESLVLSLVYIMVLILMSVIFGLLAWNNEKNHHETRWILGIVVLSVPVWVVFCVVAGLGEYKMRDAAVAIGLLINATIMLGLGPVRKLYLLSQFEQQLEEEEKKSALGNGSQRGGDYSSMYGRQYDNLPELHESDSVRGSMMGNDYVPYQQARGPAY